MTRTPCIYLLQKGNSQCEVSGMTFFLNALRLCCSSKDSSMLRVAVKSFRSERIGERKVYDYSDRCPPL